MELLVNYNGAEKAEDDEAFVNARNLLALDDFSSIYVNIN